VKYAVFAGFWACVPAMSENYSLWSWCSQPAANPGQGRQRTIFPAS
jgi:hypothetical protein